MRSPDEETHANFLFDVILLTRFYLHIHRRGRFGMSTAGNSTGILDIRMITARTEPVFNASAGHIRCDAPADESWQPIYIDYARLRGHCDSLVRFPLNRAAAQQSRGHRDCRDYSFVTRIHFDSASILMFSLCRKRDFIRVPIHILFNLLLHSLTSLPFEFRERRSVIKSVWGRDRRLG